MEREILYRGKGMFNGQWIEGYYVRIGCGWEERHYIFSGKEDTQSRYDPIYEKTQVDPVTVGQYTGLMDRNGKMIFEGDILKIGMVIDKIGDYYYPPIEYPVNVLVRWDLCAWTWEAATEPKYYIHFPEAWSHYGFEVIGNIVDNPELLEVMK